MKPILKDILLGADPELFVVEKATGAFIPSLDLVGGAKWAPRPTSIPGFFVQEDNVLVEYNIPPSKTREEFKDNIILGMRLFEEFLPEHLTTKIQASHKFTPAQLDDPRAQEFGCESDQNCWLGGEFNPRPPIPLDGLRSAGGHIHVGYTIDEEAVKESGDFMVMPEKIDINRHIVQWLDLYLGVPSMKMDKDRERKKLYGKAGAYRDKKYGPEYRTLSSFWLRDDAHIKWAFDQTIRAANKVSTLEVVPVDARERIQAAINIDDQYAIDSLIDEFELELV